MMRTLLAAALTWVAQRLCGLFGHDLMIEHGPHRLRVVCAACGWQSHGIEVSKGKAATSGARTDPIDQTRFLR